MGVEQVVVDVIWTPICVTGSKIKAQVSKERIGKGYGSGTRDGRLTCIRDDVVDVLPAVEALFEACLDKSRLAKSWVFMKPAPGGCRRSTGFRKAASWPSICQATCMSTVRILMPRRLA